MHILFPLLLSIPLSHSLILPNLRPSLPLPHNLSSTTTIPGVVSDRAPSFCKGTSAAWAESPSQLPLDIADCTIALGRFFVRVVQPHLRDDYEFLGPKAWPRFGKYPRVAVTPRKYEHGTCVLAIAMINFYPSSVLRERGEGPFANNDLARYLSIWARLREIIFTCGGPGWAAVGDEGQWGQNIGAFVWTKGSDMDERTPNETI
ncbi:MAG: hypothetical protein Q9208_007832 [Pyrenodesmia sp. 3 TL-2023]